MTTPQTTPGKPDLSIIIPAYNEAQRLPETLGKVKAFVAQSALTAEVLIVENGSTDNTAEIAHSFAVEHPFLRVLHSAKGKGVAVQTGMLAAQGLYRCMCDADFSMPIDELPKLVAPLLQGADVAIASREAPGAQRYGEPTLRHWMGRIFNGIERLLVLPHFRDTQCGFKCFRHVAADQIFSRQTMNGWSFDLEIIVIALTLGFQVAEVPVNWYYDPDSKISPVQHSVAMLRDLFTIRRNWRSGGYNQPRKADPANLPAAEISSSFGATGD